MDWSRYAQVYDFMSDNNPAYQQLLVEMRVACIGALAKLDFEEFNIVDVGAGTGNLTLQLAMTFPKAKVLHVDPDVEMLRLAEQKAEVQGCSNIEYLRCKAEDLSFSDSSFDLITSMHSFYAIRDPASFVSNMCGWLKPAGSAVVCDFGRVMNTTDWSKYLLGSWSRQYGPLRAARLGLRALSVRASNQEISKKQKSGEYWTHDLEEFEGLFKQNGFRVVSSAETYRGFSDLVVAEPQSRLVECRSVPSENLQAFDRSTLEEAPSEMP